LRLYPAGRRCLLVGRSGLSRTTVDPALVPVQPVAVHDLPLYPGTLGDRVDRTAARPDLGMQLHGRGDDALPGFVVL